MSGPVTDTFVICLMIFNYKYNFLFHDTSVFYYTCFWIPCEKYN